MLESSSVCNVFGHELVLPGQSLRPLCTQSKISTGLVLNGASFPNYSLSTMSPPHPLPPSPCRFPPFAHARVQNGVQTCILKGHNARLTSVTKENLLARHRQCVKPDQVRSCISCGGLSFFREDILLFELRGFAVHVAAVLYPILGSCTRRKRWEPFFFSRCAVCL